MACSGGATAVTGPADSPSGTDASLRSVEVQPSELTLRVGESARLNIRGRDNEGQEVSLSARDVEWTSSAPGVASVDSTGLVSAMGDGDVSIAVRVNANASDRSMRDTAHVIAEPRSGGGTAGDPGNPTNAFRAFPGAEGWGAEALTQCDRSQVQVLAVDNLQDSGSGSLRDAISRVRSDVLSIVVFRVAGYIDLDNRIEIDDGSNCLYIAGQTAPGDGITVRAWDGQGILFRSGPVHDVVIRYIRFRNGTKSPGTHTAAQGLLVGTGTNVVLDHLSFSWANDQLFSIYKYPHGWGPLHSLTLQRSLFAEPLASSPVCYSIGGDKTGSGDGVPEMYKVDRITFHHNAALHCSHRVPGLGARSASVINSVVYNWNQGAMHTGRKIYADFIGNYFQRGPMNRSLDADFAYEFSHSFGTNTPRDVEPDGYRIIGNTNNVDGRAGPALYLEGNVGPNNPSGSLDDWSMTSKYKNDEREGLPESYYGSVRYADVGRMPISVDGVRLRRDARLPRPPIPVTVEGAFQAWNGLIENGDVGANRRLTCAGAWVDMTDDVDRRVLAEARNGTGRSSALDIESQSEVGGFPPLESGSACPDSDSDGMPDQFEAGFGLDPRNASDRTADADGDGYTNLEEYLNGTQPR